MEFYASEFVLVLLGLVLLDSVSGYVFVFAVYFSCDDMYGMFMFKVGKKICSRICSQLFIYISSSLLSTISIILPCYNKQ